ncbi:MAG: hypothetical protein P8176_10230, partial [Gammaproteobacteria bacterium]
MKKLLTIVAASVLIAGCSTAAVKAWKSADFKKTLGTDDVSFILDYDRFQVITGKYYNEKTYENYSKNVCRLYNEDGQLITMVQQGLIQENPTCFKSNSLEGDLIVEVGTLKEKCFMGCLDKYIKYYTKDGKVLAYSEMKDLPYMEGIRYSIGHIKNMIIAANIQKNRDNPEWVAKLKKACRKDK